MKVVVNCKDVAKERPFPKLMISNTGNIVLFTSNKTGTIIVIKEGCYNVGWYSAGWCMDYFKDYSGSITLSDD